MFVVVNLLMAFGSSIGAVVTREGGRSRASVLQTAMAVSKCRLAQTPMVVTPTTIKADLVAAEADYDGYTAGGNTLTTWGAPLDSPSGGAATATETTFAYVDDTTHTANTITAGWVELAAGGVMFGFNFANPIVLNADGTGFVLQLIDTEGVS